MDIFDEEILKFWAALQNQDVRYIMVGGYATNLHGFQRYTGDIDIWIEDSLENRKQLRKAFVECGFEFRPYHKHLIWFIVATVVPKITTYAYGKLRSVRSFHKEDLIVFEPNYT